MNDVFQDLFSLSTGITENEFGFQMTRRGDGIKKHGWSLSLLSNLIAVLENPNLVPIPLDFSTEFSHYNSWMAINSL